MLGVICRAVRAQSRGMMVSRVERAEASLSGRRAAVLRASLPAVSILAVLVWAVSMWAMPERIRAESAGPEPEKVYRQLRREPVIHTREEALAYLAQVSASELRRSVKLSVDERVKDVLSHPGFESLDRETRDSLHANLLGIRSFYWSRDLAQLARSEQGLRELSSSGALVSAAETRERGEGLQAGVRRLVEQLQMCLTLESCTRAREEQAWGAAGWLDCMLNGGPGA
jgi:hypothetical protein